MFAPLPPAHTGQSCGHDATNPCQPAAELAVKETREPGAVPRPDPVGLGRDVDPRKWEVGSTVAALRVPPAFATRCYFLLMLAFVVANLPECPLFQFTLAINWALFKSSAQFVDLNNSL